MAVSIDAVSDQGGESPPLVRAPARSAAEVCAYAMPSAEALALLDKQQTPREYLDLLLTKERFGDAIRFLAFALPWREVVWWGCLCVRHSAPALPSPQEEALGAAVRWVIDPSESHRLDAERLADTSTASGYLARAVAWTAGSMLPPGMPIVPPGPDLPHRGVEAAVTFAVTSAPPNQMKESYRHALALGIQVARGRYLWTDRPQGTSEDHGPAPEASGRRVPSTRGDSSKPIGG